MEEVPNLDFLHKVLRSPFSKKSLFPMETIIVTRPNPTKLVHDESQPPPCSLGLDVVPKLMLNLFTSVREAGKHTAWRWKPK